MESTRKGIILGKFLGSREAFEQWAKKLFDHLWYYDPEDLYLACVGFLDDLIFAAKSKSELNSMFNDLWEELLEMDLQPQPRKLMVMCNSYVRDTSVQVRLGPFVAKDVQEMEILGSIVAANIDESMAYQHRIAQSWKIFHKWREPLCCKQVSIDNRAKLWNSTVKNSMVWALETTRGLQGNYRKIRTAQRRQFVKMIGRKRQPTENGLEDWVSWQKRIFREAIAVIDCNGLDIARALKKKKTDFVAHISRFGIGDRETHLVKHYLLWRPKAWWNRQQEAIEKEGHPFVHPRVGRIKRYEDQFPLNWVAKYSKEALAEYYGN